MLRVCTTQKNVQIVKDVFVPALQNIKGLKYKFEPVTDHVPMVEAGNVVLMSGGFAVELMKDEGLVPKGRSINSLREKVVTCPAGGGSILITYDPGITQREADKMVLCRWDARLAARLAMTGSLSPEIGDYSYTEGFQRILEIIGGATKKSSTFPIPISLDLETVGLDPFRKPSEDHPGARIVSVSLTYAPGQADVYYVPEEGADEYVIDELALICNSPFVKLIGANLKFDALWLLTHWGIEITNHKFDTTLVGSLLDENISNSLNIHAKLYTAMGGYDDCVAPGTKVCTADLRWVPVEDIKPGDKLVGFDEEIPGPKQRRRMRVAVAESTKIIKKPICRVVFSNGTSIWCSQDHGFLAHKYKSNGPFQWLRAKDLRQGCRVQLAVPVVSQDDSFDAGYVSGLYDGEGYLSHQGAGITSGISQRPGPVWDEYSRIMESKGFGGFYARQKNTEGVMTSKHSGWQTLQILQTFRPLRLLEKCGYEGHTIPSGAPKVTVAYVEILDEEREVVSLQTSTHTFVAEGICSHNSFNQSHDKSRMDLVPKEELLPYAGGDTDACLKTYHVLRKELINDDALANLYTKLVQPASNVFTKLEHRGVVVDLDRYKELAEEVGQAEKRFHDKAVQLLPRRLQMKYAHDLRLSRRVILQDYLFTKRGLNLEPVMTTAKKKEPTTSMDHMEELLYLNPSEELERFVYLMKEWGSAKKTLTTYIVGFMKHIRSDGKFHPSYMLYRGAYGDKDATSGTVTGRLSCKDPAFQTIPKHTVWAKPLRSVLVPPPGYAILKLDYSQGELRVTACVADEKVMINTYRAGIDLHLKTGAMVNGIDLDDALAMREAEDPAVKDIRQGGKAGNFGLIYGMGPPGFQEYAKTTYGVHWDLDKCTEVREQFFETYPGLVAWHERYKKIAKMQKAVRNPLGRIRHLPLISSGFHEVRAQSERQAINSPIQSTLSDMMLLAMVEIDRQYPDLWMFGMVHDDLGVYVPENEILAWASRLKEIMENLPLHEFGWSPQLRFPVDTEASTVSMAECIAI